MVPNIFDFCQKLKEGVFRSKENNNFWFIYQILSDGKAVEFDNQVNLSWSVFIKKGKKSVPVFQYHPFSREMLDTLLRHQEKTMEYSDASSLRSLRSPSAKSVNSCMSHFVQDEEIANMVKSEDYVDDPLHILTLYLRLVITTLAEHYIKEARENGLSQEEWISNFK